MHYGSSQTVSSPLTLVRTRTGDRVRGYRQLISEQRNATSPMVGVFEDIQATSGDNWVSFTRPVKPYDICTNRASGYLARLHLVSFWTPLLTEGKADNRAMQSFLKSINQAQIAFKGATFLGELRQTMHMIKHPADGLLRHINDYKSDLKRLKTRKPKKWKKDISGLWLEYAFGWVPLLNDVKTGYEAYYKVATNRPRSIPVTGFGIEKASAPVNYMTSILNQTTVENTGRYSWQRVATEEVIVRYRGMIKNGNDTPLFSSLAKVGFNPLEFIPTAWELVPWSFLIDYFTNIGDILEAAVTDVSEVAWTNRTRISILRQVVSTRPAARMIVAPSYPTYLDNGGQQSIARYTRRGIGRSVNVSTYVPNLEFSIPGLTRQYVNMGALLAQFNGLHPQRTRHLRF